MAEATETSKQFAIQKLYLKDVSFESPMAPQALGAGKWEPRIDLNLGNRHTALDNDLYEVVLTITVTVSQQDQTAFLVEVHQAGIFLIAGFDDAERNYLLGSQCMNIMFPYAREAVSDLSVRGGFPPLVLSPVNFDHLYQQHLQQQARQQADEPDEAEPAS